MLAFDTISFTNTADFVPSLSSIRVKALRFCAQNKQLYMKGPNDLNVFENIIVLMRIL